MTMDNEEVESLIWIHIGTIHEKINIVLKDEGLSQIPDKIPIQNTTKNLPISTEENLLTPDEKNPPTSPEKNLPTTNNKTPQSTDKVPTTATTNADKTSPEKILTDDLSSSDDKNCDNNEGCEETKR